MAKSRELKVAITGDSSSLNKELNKAGKNAGIMGGQMAKAAKVAGAGLAAAGVAAFKVGESFDKAYDTIRVGTGATGKTLKGLEKDFKSVVKNVPASFGDASTAVADLNTRLGLTGKTLQGRSKQFLELSRITKTDVATNIKTVTRAFGDWEVKTGDQTAQLDKFFRAAQSSGATVEELASQVVQFGAPLRQVGFTLDEATAMFASFEKAGVNTQTMMPGLKQALKSFLEAGKDPRKELAKTFEGIQKGTIKASDALEIFGARAGADMVEAVQQGRFNLEDLTKALQDGSDTVMKAGKDTRSFGEQWTMFKNNVLVKLEPIAIRVFDGMGKLMEGLGPKTEDATRIIKAAWPSVVDILNVVKGAVSAVTGVIGGVVKAFKENKTWAVVLVSVMAGLTASFVAYKVAVLASAAATKVATTAAKVMAAAQAALNIVMKANPIGIVITVLIGLGAALTVAYKKSETFRDIVNGVWSAVKEAAKVAFGFILGILDKLMGAWSSMLSALGKVPGFGWAKDAADKIDRARETLRGLRDGLKKLPRKKKTDVEVEVRFKGLGALLDQPNSMSQKMPSGDGLGAAIGKAAVARVPKSITLKGSAGGLRGAHRALAPIAAVGARFGLSVSSGLRPGASTSSGNASYHGTGEAVDLAGPPAAMLRTFRALKATVGGRLAELIYTPGGVGIRNGRPHTYSGAVAADHHDHIHAALDLGTPGVGIGAVSHFSRRPKTGDGIGEAVRAGRAAGFSGSDLVTMVAIAGPESSYRNSARLVTSAEDSRGMWQINTKAHPWALNMNLTNSTQAAQAARKVWQQSGRSWRPWTAYTSGTYKRFMEQARAAVIGSRGGASSGGGGGGGSSAAPSRSEARARSGSRLVNRIAQPYAKGFRKTTLRASKLGTLIEDASTSFGQAERAFGQTDEDLGTAAGRTQRLSEIGALAELRKKTLDRQKRRATALQRAINNRVSLLRKLRRARDKAKGSKRAKINDRIGPIVDRLDELKAELKALGFAIRDTELDIGDLAQEAGEVAATPDTPVEPPPSAAEQASGLLSDIELQERAGLLSPADARQRRLDTIANALKGGYGALDQRQTWELMAQQIEVTGQQTQATNDLAQALKEVKGSIDRQNALAESSIGVELRQAQRAFGDMLSRELGPRVAARGHMPGDGSLARM